MIVVAITVRICQRHVQPSILGQIALRYTLPHASFSFMLFAILFQSIKDEFAAITFLFDDRNLLSSAGSSVVVVLLLFMPLSRVCCKQTFRRLRCAKRPAGMSKKTYLTKEEWKYYSQRGE